MHDVDDPLVPFSFHDKLMNTPDGKVILAGDVGGTKTNLALFRTEGKKLERIKTINYPSSEFKSVIHMLHKFTEDEVHKPVSICLGVAGPVINGKVEMTNLDWDLDLQEIRTATGIQTVTLLNDLEATAYGLAGFEEEDFITVHEGVYRPGNMAILSPGTGLGEAGLYFDGRYYHPFPTEGGHCDFSPRSQFDFDLHQYLQRKYGIVSWEKLISGSGIYDTYQFLRDERSMEEPAWLKDEIAAGDPAAIISHNAMQEKSDICIETMDTFVRYLARESCNLVLKIKSIGGLFLGGGISPKIASLIQREVFMRDFLDCDRMQHLLENVPVRIIVNQKAPMLGAAYYAAYGS